MIRLAEVHLDAGWFGHPAALVESSTGAKIAMITRLGKGMLIDEHTVIQEGDLVHLMMNEKDLASIESTLATPPAGH
jgi:trk system potassium uptake protein TrkA